MPKKEKPEFDNIAHEAHLAERYRRLQRFEVFDRLVDMALDGVISMEEAKHVWETGELELPYTYGTPATE